MNIIEETELILTPEKKIYHLNLSKEEIAKDIILVGDPARAKLISSKFDHIEYIVKNREFTTYTGNLNKKRITTIATGIGTDNIDIVINELDALVNINFETRTINKKKKSLNLIRLGTSGALQKSVKVDSLLLAAYGLGFDGLAHFYKNKDVLEEDMSRAFNTHTNWPNKLATPYFVKASMNLLNKFPEINKGITATASGFYGPQGRELRLTPYINDMHKNMESFKAKDYKITNFEMETSALYYLGKSLGHKTLTICAIIGNRITREYSKDYKKTVEEMVDIVLNRIC